MRMHGTPTEFRSPDGLRMMGDVFGADNDGLLIVFTHGGAQSRSSWRGAAMAMAEAGYRAVSMDLRGHGESDWAPDGDYSLYRYADDIASVIDTLGGPAVLVGASLGGHVALFTATHHPEKVVGLALADVTPWIDETIGDEKRTAMLAGARGFATIADAAEAINAIGHAPPRHDHERLRPHLNEREDGRLYWKWDARFISDAFLRHGGEGGLLVAEAKRLAVPVLLMRAEFSTLTFDEQEDAFRATVPWLESVIIPNAHHMVTGDVNDAYASAVRAFVARSIPDAGENTSGDER